MAEPSVRTSHRGPCPAIKAFETNYHNNLQWPSDSLKMIVSYFKRVCFNVKDALDFFIAQTVLVDVDVPSKTWL